MIRIIFSVEFIRNFICFLRALYLIKVQKKLRKLVNKSENIWENTLESNLRHVFDEKILPEHPKKLASFFGINLKFAGGNINYLYSLVKNDLEKLPLKKILVVGPRNESEIFNLYSKGFNLNKIDAIDLFSYSKKITLADAHTYIRKKNYYDIIFLGWVLAYSNNKELMLKNLKKNLNDDGYLIVGYSVSNLSDKEIMDNRGYLISSPYNRLRDEKDLKNFFLQNNLSIIKSEIIYKKGTHIKLAFKLKKSIDQK